MPPALAIVMATTAETPGIQGDALFATAAVALMPGAIVTGVCCLLIGHFRLANLVRFIPYPVAGGFVAGIGGGAFIAAMSRMGAITDWHALPALIKLTVLWKWSPGVIYGSLVHLAIRRWGSALILPISVGIAIPAYDMVPAAIGPDTEAARSTGLVFTSTAEGMLWPTLRPSDLGNVHWAALAMKALEMLTLVLVALICVVMNFAGLEVAANRDMEWDREFRVGGLASVVAGLGGGTLVTVIVPASLRSKLLGATTRLTGVVTAAVIGVGLSWATGCWNGSFLHSWGIIVLAGSGMLDQGLVTNRKRIPWSDYSIIVFIFIAIVIHGLLEGEAAGMLATQVFFAVRPRHMDPIESRFNALDRGRRRARPIPDRAILVKEDAAHHEASARASRGGRYREVPNHSRKPGSGRAVSWQAGQGRGDQAPPGPRDAVGAIVGNPEGSGGRRRTEERHSDLVSVRGPATEPISNPGSDRQFCLPKVAAG